MEKSMFLCFDFLFVFLLQVILANIRRIKARQFFLDFFLNFSKFEKKNKIWKPMFGFLDFLANLETSEFARNQLKKFYKIFEKNRSIQIMRFFTVQFLLITVVDGRYQNRSYLSLLLVYSRYHLEYSQYSAPLPKSALRPYTHTIARISFLK